MAAEKAPQEPAGNPHRLFVIIIIVLMLTTLGEAGYIGYRAFFGPEKKGAKAGKAEARDRKKGKAGEGEGVRAKSALALEPFLVNLADTPHHRYARVTLKLGLSVPPDVLAEKIAKNDVIIAKLRDVILSLLCSKRSDDLMTEEGKRNLRKEIMERTTHVLPEGSVEEVFFMDFVVQL